MILSLTMSGFFTNFLPCCLQQYMNLLMSSGISELIILRSFQKWPQVCPLPSYFSSYSDHLGKLLCSNSLTFHCPEKLRVTCKPKYSNFWIWMKMLRPSPALVPEDSHYHFFQWNASLLISQLPTHDWMHSEIPCWFDLKQSLVWNLPKAFRI